MAKSAISDLKVAISSLLLEFKSPLGNILNMCTKFEKKISIRF